MQRRSVLSVAVRLANIEQRGGLGLFHVALFHDGVDLEHQLRLDQMLIRIRHTDILEHIAAPAIARLRALYVIA